MKTAALTLVRKHFNSPLVADAINRRNRLAWCRSVRLLGDRWLLAKPIAHHNGATQ